VTVRLGAWFFRNRSWFPVPLALIVILVTAGSSERPWLPPLGAALVAAGEAVRLWSVRHIGVRSRTRSANVGPLVETGPYALTRNPLYVGNFLLWTGFVVWSRLLWMLPVAWALFTWQIVAIVAWEEERLRQQFPEQFAAYAQRVPRWLPRPGARPPRGVETHSWSHVLFSERGTLGAIALMALLLVLKDLTR
jgi:protein-S-isoprenylcysteine O-methyltransferase Ste14